MAEYRGLPQLIDAWIAAKPGRNNTALAKASGLSRSYISRLRRGEREGFKPHTVGALAQGLGVRAEVVAKAASVRVSFLPMTFREYVTKDVRLSAKQKDDLLHTYYETFGVKDDSTD